MVKTVTNPLTNRKIIVGGKTYNNLISDISHFSHSIATKRYDYSVSPSKKDKPNRSVSFSLWDQQQL